MKRSLFGLSLITLFASVLSVNAYTVTGTPDALFDVGISGSAVAPGWAAVFPVTPDTSTTATAAQNGITITITADTASVLDARDRGTGTRLDVASINPGGVFDEVLQDFIFDNSNSTGDINTVEFTGLIANTVYKITSIHFDNGSAGPFATNWHEGSTGGTLLGTWTSSGAPPVSASDFVELNVTSDGSGTITLAAESTTGGLRFSGFIVERVTPSSDVSYLIDFDSANGSGPYTESGWSSLFLGQNDTSGSVDIDGVTFSASWTGGGTRSRGEPNNTPLTRDFGFTSDSEGITLELGEAGSLPAGIWEVSMWSYDSNVPIAPAEVGYRVNGVVETVTSTALPEDPIFPVATFQFVSDGVSSYEVFLRDDLPGVGQDSSRLNAVSLKLVERTEYRIDVDSTNNGGPIYQSGWTSLTLDTNDPSGSVAEGGVTFSISGLSGSRTRPGGTTLTRDFGYASGAASEITMELGSAGDIPAGTWEVSMWAYDGSAFVGDADVGYREDNGVDPAVETVTGTSLPQDSADPITTFQFTSDGTSSYEIFMRVAATETTTESIRFNAMTLRLAPTPVVKENNTDDLDLGTSWVGGTAPGAFDLADWDSAVTGTNTTVLGSDTTWAGIVIEDPAGDVTISAGNTLTLDDRGTLIDMSAATANLNLNCDLVVLGSDIWEVATGRTLSVGGAVSGSSGIDLVGDGTVILSGANSYVGDTSVGTGTIQLGAADVIPNGSGSGDVTVSGTLDLNGSSDTINGLSGSGTVDNTADSTSATLTVGDDDASSTFNGILQNSGSSATLNLEKTGSGTLTLGGANTYDGTTNVSEGALEIGSLSALGNTSAITLAGGTTFAPTLDGVTVSAPITLGSTGTTSTVDLPVGGAATLTLDGAIDGDGNLLLDRSVGGVTAGMIVLGVQSTYLGTTKFDTAGGISSGSQLTVQLGVADALPSTTVLTLDGGPGAGSGRTLSFDLNGLDQTLAGLQNVSGQVARRQQVTSTGAATLTIDNSADYTFGGSEDFSYLSNPYTTRAEIIGDISLVKAGVGTFTLFESHTYTGSTSVNGGTLGLDDASLDSAITVAGGASLEFTLGSPSSTSSTLNLSTGTVKIDGAVNNSSDYQLMTASSITGTLTLDSGIPDYELELRNSDTELWLAYSAAAYAAWAATNAPTDADPSLDEDGDGVNNGAEYVLGGLISTNDIDKLPTVATSGGDMTFTFIRDQASVDGSTTVEIEVGTTLSAWPTVYTVGADTGSSSAGVTVVDNANGTDTVTLTITRAPDDAKFARLSIAVPSP